MATNLEFKLTIDPVGYDDIWPKFQIEIDNESVDSGLLTESRTYNFNINLEDGNHSLRVLLTNKTDTDTVVKDGNIVNDKAIRITCLEIEGYQLDDFMHRAVYYPEGRDSLKSNYIGWNGHWQLDFTTPIFTWIHKTQHLGWIYND